jgi:hypothetical protein
MSDAGESGHLAVLRRAASGHVALDVDLLAHRKGCAEGLHGGLMYRAIAGLNGWMLQRVSASQILEEHNYVFHR